MAPRVRFEDIVGQVRELDEDLAETLSTEFGATALRKQAGRAQELEVELERANSKILELETAPKKDQLFKGLGVDFDALRPAERDLLRSIKPESGDPDEAWAEKVIEQYQLPVGTPPEAPEDSGAARVAGQARQAPAGGPKRSGVVTPEDVAALSINDRRAFMKANPEAWDRLMQGDEVTGVTLPA